MAFASFQNCADVQFSERSSNSAEVANLSEGNGELYTGRYLVIDVQNICPDSEILSEIVQSNEEKYYLLKDQCEVFKEPVEVSEQVTLHEGNVVFNGKIYVDEQIEVDAVTDEIPTSCQEILDKNLSRGNGFYLVNPQGQDVEEVYCNMEILQSI